MRPVDGDELADMLSGVRRRLDPKAYTSEAELYIRDNMLLNLEQIIRSAPTIDPVKHAHYVIDWLGDSRCSNCGSRNVIYTCPYCPDCGAMLDEPEVHEE